MAVAHEAIDVADVVRPAVDVVVEEAEPQEGGIGKPDAGDAAGIGRMLIDAVRGEGEAILRGGAVRPPASAPRLGAALFRRILGIELRRHRRQHIGGQARCFGDARAGHEGVVAFLDARRRPQQMARNDDRREDCGRNPAHRPRRHRSGEDRERRCDREAIAREIIDRKAEDTNDENHRRKTQRQPL